MKMNRRLGLQTHRFKNNPEEQRFADKWYEFEERGLPHLLDTRPGRVGPAPAVYDRDRDVAATVIQWLGSPVGQYFLSSLGYEKGPRGALRQEIAALKFRVSKLERR